MVLALFASGFGAIAGAAPAATEGQAIDLSALGRDDDAAEAALASGDVSAALRYFDYDGHEQEDFARATLEYRRARQALGDVVRDTFGRATWSKAAVLLGVPRHRRGGAGEPDRVARRDGSVVYVKNLGANNEVPYVNVDGVWKVSVRDVLLTALRARFGKSVEYEEADLHVLAGKMARVLRGRAKQLSSMADDVKAKRFRSADDLLDAVDRVRRPPPADAAPRE